MADADIALPYYQDYAERIVMHATFIHNLGPQLEDGEQIRIREVKDGMLHGVSIIFYKMHDSILKQREDHFQEDMRHGQSTIYGLDGIPVTQSHYQNNLLHGPSVIYRENGAIDTLLYFQDDFPDKNMIDRLKLPLLAIQLMDNVKDTTCKILGLPVMDPHKRAGKQLQWLARHFPQLNV